MAHSALSAVAHAKRAVYEQLELNGRRCRTDGADLVERQFAGQDGSVETKLLEKSDSGWREVVHLGAGNQRDRGRSHSSKPALDDGAVG